MSRMLGDQQRLGVLPGAAAVLLDVPRAGADGLEKPAALFSIGDQPAERQFRIVMEQHLADVEDDVADVRHSFSLAMNVF